MVYRPDAELHRRAQVAAGEIGLDMNAAVIAFLGWLVGDTDELRRPDAPVPSIPPAASRP